VSALDILHALVLDDGRPWGLAATEWQRADAEAVLEPGPDEPRLHWLGRPKGGSKSTDLAAFSIAWLVEQAGPLEEGYVCAADREQANRLLDKARGFVRRTPELAEVIDVQANRIVHRRSQARVNALEADVASSEGLLSPWLLVDELPNWADTKSARAMWRNVVSSVPKVRGCRLVVIGHAGDTAHWSHKVLADARELGWRVQEVPGPLPWISEADLAMQERMLLPSEFARRHLNRWTAGEDRLVADGALAECAVLEGPLRPQPGVTYQMALDVGLVNDRTVAVVCHAEQLDGPMWGTGRDGTLGDLERDREWREMQWLAPHEQEALRARRLRDGGDRGRALRVVLDRIEVWEGKKSKPVRLAEVGSWLLEASRTFNGAGLVFDPFQAVGLAQRLEDSGVRTSSFTFSSASVGRLARTLHQLLRDRAFVLPADDQELLEELRNVRIVEKQPGVFRMDHDRGRHDDRAVALALAAHQLLEDPPAAPAGMSRYRQSDLLAGRGRAGRRAR
jgi:phage terminase large subunit-like protein